MTGNRPPVRIKRLPHGKDLSTPQYATPGSVGLDLRAALGQPVTLAPAERALIPTGFALEIPPGLEGQVRPRSGLAVKKGVTVLNSPGTIDPDYRGEVQVILVNLGAEPVSISPGERIAQLVFAPAVQVKLEEVETLDASARGEGGFGHTGHD